jgi:hypothetical protein
VQEWGNALKDLNFVLLFKPDNDRARLLRARVFTCMRRWDKAREDYDFIIELHFDKGPFSAVAHLGLADINVESTDMPMMNEKLLNNVI